MRIPSGVTDQYIYFVAVDATDFATRETGLSSFTVYRSRNGAAAAAMTTPTINETDSTNMPGVYELLCDEDMTIDSGDDSQAMVFHVTHAGMAPVTLSLELYRVKVTAGETLTVSSGVGSSNVVQISGDSTAADNLESYCDGTTPMPVNATQLSGDSTAADNAEAFFDGTGYAGTNNVIPTVTNVTNLHGSAATSANQTTILNRLGSFTGSGVNTILGFFQALMRSDSTTPSDLGGTYDDATDSMQAIRDHISDGSNLTEAGGTGDHLTAIPWNAAWDAEVQSEAADALTAYDAATQSDLNALNDVSSAEVKAMVVEAIATDTYGQPASVIPATTTISNILTWLGALSRNKINQTNTTQSLRNDADSGNMQQQR